ncbi:MAG: BrnT family toxin [Pseudohongiella sp.]|nr:BrnT family toxin [Pseudohongiella sp.]
MVEFEFDHSKSKANLDKHGIDFHAAQALWNDPNLLELQVRSDNEPRFIVIGCIYEKHWSAIVTYRNEKIRLISVRRSRKKEVMLYES